MVKRAEGRMSQRKQRKECHSDLQNFDRKILDDESFTAIQPTYSKQEAESYFVNTCTSMPKSFTSLPWMPEAPPLTIPLVTCEFTEEEACQKKSHVLSVENCLSV